MYIRHLLRLTAFLVALAPVLASAGLECSAPDFPHVGGVAWDPVKDELLTGYRIYINGSATAEIAPDDTMADVSTINVIEGSNAVYVTAFGADPAIESGPSNTVEFVCRESNLPSTIVRLFADETGQDDSVVVTDPEFGGLGTCITGGDTDVSSISSTITGVAAGDLILTLLQRDDMDSVTGVAFSGHAMTQLAQVNSGSGGFYFEVWGAISPSEYASTDIVASFSTPASWGSMVSARWGNVASATPVQSATTGGLSSASINRFAGSITTTERMLVIGAGTDWDNYNSHTAENGYTLHFANNAGHIGCTKSVQWLYSQVLDAGTYGGDATGTRFGTAESDKMLSAILAFPLKAGY